MKKKILITGVTGFLGPHLVRRLLSDGKYNLILIKRRSSKIDRINDFLDSVKVYDIDPKYLHIYSILKNEKPDLIIHLAAAYLREETKEGIDNMTDSNILFGIKLIDAMRENDITRLINVGSSTQFYLNNTIYNPASFYAATKKAFQDVLEYYVRSYGFKVVTLIPYNSYGPFDSRPSLFSFLKKSIDSKKEISLTKGEQKMDYIYIDDFVEAYIKTINYLFGRGKECHEEIIIGSGKAVKLRDLVLIYQKLLGRKLPLVFGGKPYRKREIMLAEADIRKASEILKWRPKVSLEEGIKRTLKLEGII